MNKEMKQHLEAVVEAIIFSDTAAANTAFHEYLNLKTQSILLGEAEDKDEDKDEKSDDKDEDKDDKKEDKKNPFAKKDKKDKKEDTEDKDEE